MSMTNVDKDEHTALQQKVSIPGHENLTAQQQESLRDMRASLKQMKRGELLPARQSLREIDQELDAEDNVRISDA